MPLNETPHENFLRTPLRLLQEECRKIIEMDRTTVTL